MLPPWEMYLDGAARQDGAGAGVVFVSPEKHILPYSFVLTQLCSNNMAEYQALIMGLQMAVKMGIQDLDVYGDSLSHVPRSANKMADLLAGLAATLALGEEEAMSLPVCNC
uniref:RNase H type-1 domain-containing protein n=1 Tax=Chenopodium quinoa TaxID=63459 RepID=A0A803N616_CHEQI